MDTPHTGKTLKCVVVTPERTVLDTTVDFVAVPMYDGELGVLPGRSALIGRLGPGELRIRHGRDVQRYFVDGGFAQVRDNVVTVLTPRAIKAQDINVQSATQVLEQKPTAEAQLKAQQRARVQLRVARRASGEPVISH